MVNVFVGRTFIGWFDNSKWSEENGNVPFVDIGAEHVYEYYYREEQKNGQTKVHSRRSDEGTLG